MFTMRNGQLLIITISSITTIYILIILGISIFSFAWNIIGAVVLFRDSMDCLEKNNPIWVMTFAYLILQWFVMLVNCCLKIETKHEGYTKIEI